MNDTATLGFRAHSGWAAVVAVAGSPDLPVILERLRIELAEIGIRGSKQPFMLPQGATIDTAASLICRCRDSSHCWASEPLLR